MAIQRKLGLRRAMGVGAIGSLLLTFALYNSCQCRRISSRSSQRLPGNPRQFDPYVDGKVLATRLCGEGYSEIRYLYASGRWVDGKLDALETGARAEIVAARNDGQRCAIAVSLGQARRTDSTAVYRSGWAWPKCSTSDLWSHARSSGFKFPQRVSLTFNDTNGVAIGAAEGESLEWKLKAGDPCKVSPRSFVDSLILWTASHLAQSLFEGAQSGQSLLTTLADAQRGCRSPEEMGCAQCCLQLLRACQLCQELSALPNSYICSPSSPSRPCPANCQRCAQCSTYDESKLRSAPSRPECNCRIAIVGDACFDLSSCDCYCQRLGPSIAACPGIL